MRMQLLDLPFVIDAGNAFVKYVVGDTEGVFVHKIAELMPGEYEDGQSRYGRTAGIDFIKMNGKSYAVGATADNYQVQHRVGAPKYKRDYYGVLFASAVGRAFIGRPSLLANGLRVMASHASRDYDFRKALKESIKGRWIFECGGVKFNFEVKDVKTYEEPFGGYARLAFVKDNRGRWSTPLHGAEVGIIDIGGGTCGTLAVDANGIVQYGKAFSGGQGMNQVQERMRSLLKQKYPDFFQTGAEIPDDRIRHALATGIYKGGGTEIECAQLVETACNPLLNEVETMFMTKLGGRAASDVIALTGGGNAVLFERVMDRLGHKDMRLSDDVARLQFANVIGARDFAEITEEAL